MKMNHLFLLPIGKQLEVSEGDKLEVVQRSYLLVLWVQVPPLQFSVGNVVISDSGWSDPVAESSEVKPFYK
jgi:hypothetical protein